MTANQLEHERRFKICWLTEQMLRDVLTLKWFTVFDLPADVICGAAFDSPERRAFGIVVYHETFASVPAGDIGPAAERIDTVMGWNTSENPSGTLLEAVTDSRSYGTLRETVARQAGGMAERN